MNENNREIVRAQIVDTVVMLEEPPSPWVGLADLGNTLRSHGVNYREYGYEKLKVFLETFEDLEFKTVDDEDKPPVYYVRLKAGSRKQIQNKPSVVQENIQRRERDAVEFTPDMRFSDWAFVFSGKYHSLVEMMPEEEWGKVDRDDSSGDVEENKYPWYPNLENYIANTAKRLAYEKKILYYVNPSENIKYAAFNTGLVDKSYDWIYALFKENTRYPDKAQWFLLDFVVAGQNAGKTLNSIFVELPQRANYFENLGNVLYDSSKRLECDYEHILVEHPDRLPPAFIRLTCPEFSVINGVSVEEAYSRSFKDEVHRDFYDEFSRLIQNSSSAYNMMRKHFEDAIRMTVKRVEWNHRTAVPMYYPTKNRGALLLPLMLVTPDQVDVALVVTKEPSGAYQGQTILTLGMAYENSRLVARPNSDWLVDNSIRK